MKNGKFRKNMQLAKCFLIGVYYDQIMHYIIFISVCIEEYDIIILMDVSGYFPYE